MKQKNRGTRTFLMALAEMLDCMTARQLVAFVEHLRRHAHARGRRRS